MTLPAGTVPVEHLSNASSSGPTRRSGKVRGGYLYVSTFGTDSYQYVSWVKLYRYDPTTMTATYAGQNASFKRPYGACSDRKGNVYVVDFHTSQITEFIVGTLIVKKTLADGTGYPIGCSVDPTTGNLAVTNNEDYDGSGGVLIYKHAAGTPTQYSGPYKEWPAGYDLRGNLWVEGEEGEDCTGVCVMELPKGGSSFEPASFDETIYFPGAIQWDGKYLDLGDQQYDGGAQTGIYQTAISGSTLTSVNAVVLSDSCYLGSSDTDFVNWASVATKPNGLPATKVTQILGGNDFCDERFDMWHYPAGGSPAATMWVYGGFATGQTYVTK